MDLMQACKGERPQVWELLDNAIAQGINSRTFSGEHGVSPDPWDVEAEADRIRVCGPVSIVSAWAAVGVGGCIAVVDGIVAWRFDQIVLAGIFTALTVSLLGLSAIGPEIK
jgi:hypothetical protein